MTEQFAAGTQFAGFRIVRELGRGGMGLVYLAEQPSLGRLVALKVITPSLAGDPQFRERFDREAHHAASIEHPNVIPIFETGVDGEHVYLAMRYVEGSDLAAIVREQGRLDPEHAVRVVEQIGAALDAAHAKGLIHRDVKPPNILLDGGEPDGHAYLTDFGLTKEGAADSGLTGTGAWVGTIDYAAPEQIEGGRVDARSDVYALGCVLYESLTGELPFAGTVPQKMWAHMHNPPPMPGESGPGPSGAFNPVIERALAKDPEERYPSAGDLARAARGAHAGATSASPERSVATGLAATGISPTQPSARAAGATPPAGTAGPSEALTDRLPAEPAPPPPPPLQAPPPVAPQPRRRSRAPIVIAAVAGAAAIGAIAAFALTQSGGGDDDGGGDLTTIQEAAPAESDEPADDPVDVEESDPASGSVTLGAYSPATSGYDYDAELPTDSGWSVTEEDFEGERLRTRADGPGDAFVLIDQTPGVTPGDPDEFTSSEDISHPEFGTAEKLVIPAGSSDDCGDDDCVLVQIDDGSGGGWAVLAGGPDQAANDELATQVADSISSG